MYKNFFPHHPVLHFHRYHVVLGFLRKCAFCDEQRATGLEGIQHKYISVLLDCLAWSFGTVLLRDVKHRSQRGHLVVVQFVVNQSLRSVVHVRELLRSEVGHG